jgi:hypothetical protein
VELISYEQFGKMRLSKLFPNLTVVNDPNDPSAGRRFTFEVIVEKDYWEFMDEIWVGEAIGFNEWLRLKKEPEILRSISLDFSTFPESVLKTVLNQLGLPLRNGMNFKQISELLGKPHKTFEFTKDRKSFEFICGEKDKYIIDCTIHGDQGLIYLVVLRQDYKRKAKQAITARK